MDIDVNISNRYLDEFCYRFNRRFWEIQLFDRLLVAKTTANLIEINKNNISRMDGNWSKFSDAGQNYVDAVHSYSGDLDIFGHASLFQWINSANTYSGKEFLRTLLENPDKDIEQIKKRQGAIKELAGYLLENNVKIW